MNIKKNILKITKGSLLAGSLAACSTSGAPLGISERVIENNTSCTVSTEHSINFLILKLRFPSSEFDRDCARHQIIAALLSADFSNDPQADADMKAFAILLAGMEDMEVQDVIDKISEGLAPKLQARLQGNINDYRRNLQRQGAATERRRLTPQITALETQLNDASALSITIEKPDYCDTVHYSYIRNDLSVAYPEATISLRNTTLADMGIGLDENVENTDSIKTDLCAGSFLYVSARQGLGENTVEARHERFFQDQSAYIGNGGTQELRPRLDPIIIIGYIAQKFNVSADYAERVAQTEESSIIQQRLTLRP